jgi:hypothetical protein
LLDVRPADKSTLNLRGGTAIRVVPTINNDDTITLFLEINSRLYFSSGPEQEALLFKKSGVSVVTNTSRDKTVFVSVPARRTAGGEEQKGAGPNIFYLVNVRILPAVVAQERKQ